MAIKDKTMKTLIKKAEVLAKQNKFEDAFDLLTQADGQGDPVAAYALATWYLHGRHIKKNYQTAVTLLLKASRGGVRDAFYDLAVCYEKGRGIEKDTVKAFTNYLIASQLGDKNSLYEVGRCFYYGIGTEKNRELASQFFDRWQGKRSKSSATTTKSLRQKEAA